MGAQPPQTQGLPPGETPTEEPESVAAAAQTVVIVVVCVIAAFLGIAYIGGWFFHVAFDIAQSGWESK